MTECDGKVAIGSEDHMVARQTVDQAVTVQDVFRRAVPRNSAIYV